VAARRYLLTKSQHLVGGFGKQAGDPPDIFHSYLGLASLSLVEEPDIKAVDASLCISIDARSHIESLPWRRRLLQTDTENYSRGTPWAGTSEGMDTTYVSMSGG
jgi:geranylgeranyl transferase type-1 subunit beta